MSNLPSSNHTEDLGQARLIFRQARLTSQTPVLSQSPLVEVWSAFSAGEVLPIVFHEGALSTTGYCNLLAGLLTSAEFLYPDGYQFIQDNATAMPRKQQLYGLRIMMSGCYLGLQLAMTTTQ